MSDLLYHSVMHCARTKIIFGGVSTEDLETLVKELMIDQIDVFRVKDELTTLECEPIETTRDVITEGESTSHNLTRSQEVSHAQSRTKTQGQEVSHGRSLGISRETGITETIGETQNFTSGHVSTRGFASSRGEGSGTNYASGTAQSILPDDNGGFVVVGNIIRTSN